jgi:predicted type IV restriction endonuclease
MITAAEFLKWLNIFGIHSGDGGSVMPANIQDQTFTYAVDSGVANAYVITLSPAPAALVDGLALYFKASNPNSAASTINVNGLGVTPIVTNGNHALVGGEILLNGQYDLIYNSSYGAFVIVDTSLDPSDVTPLQIQQQAFTYSPDIGSANAVVLTLTPTLGAYYDGMFVSFAANASNTGATTISIDGLGAVPIKLNGNIGLTGGEIVAGRSYQLIYNINYSAFILLNPSVIAGYLTTTLASAHIFVGNGSNIATSVAMSGDGTLNNAGALTVNTTNGAAIATRPGVQNQSYTSAIATGTANAIILALTPAIAGYNDLAYVCFKASNNNSGATTININGVGAIPIVTNGNNALVGGEILANGDYILIANSTYTAFVLINSSLSSGGVTAAQIQNQAFTYAIDSGAANAYVITLSPAPSAYVDGQIFAFQPVNSNTGASTINVNGLGATPIILNTGFGLSGQEIEIGGNYLIQYNLASTSFVLLNPTPSSFIVTAQELQNQFWSYVLDTGTTNNYAVTLSPAPGSYVDALYLVMRAAHPNTAASTINVNGLGVKNIVDNTNAALVGGEILLGSDYILMYSVHYGAFIIINPNIGGGITAAQIQQQAFTYAVDSGAANAYVVTLSPAPGSLTDGMIVAFKATNANTGASTINVNALGVVNIATNANAALVGGEILVNGDYLLQYNSTFSAFVLINSSASAGGITSAQIQQQAFTYAVDSGAANAYAVTLSPAPGSYTDGMIIAMKATNTNTATSTINVNSLGAITIISPNTLAALVGGEIRATSEYLLMYSSSLGEFILINPSIGTSIQNQKFTHALTTGSANTYALTLTPAPTAYSIGMYISFRITSGNSGASTINVNSLGAKAIVLPNLSALVGLELINSGEYAAIYNGASFVLLNPSTMSTVTKAQIQQQAFTYAVAGGTANAITLTLSPAITSYILGSYISFATPGGFNNTGATTINVNGLGANNIVLSDNSALQGGEIIANQTYSLLKCSSGYVLLNPSTMSTISKAQIQNQAFTYAVDSGTANAYVVTLSPVPAALTDGMYVSFKAGNANTGASTINVNSLGATNIVTNANVALVGGEILVSGDYLLQYNSTFSAFVLINSSDVVTSESIQSSVVPSGSAVSLTASTPTNITTLSLTKNGTYLVWGNIFFTPVGGNIESAEAWVSATSATLPDTSLYNRMQTPTGSSTGWGLQTPQIPIIVTSAPQTVYLSGQMGLLGGTGCGGLYAELL